ncbi:hypothetical protein [Pollutimonas subterranea]|nr:hypothetical protein [Pollutimonas subterranea]
MTRSDRKTDQDNSQQDAKGEKATQFDGNPNPQGAPSSPLKPKDDTPFFLEKTSGPEKEKK